MAPAWLPDGSGVLYSRERLDRSDRDWCVSELPPAGGTIRRDVCSPEPGDSLDVFESPAAARDGRLAYVWASSPAAPRAIAPRDQALGVAAPDAAAFRPLVVLPYFWAPAQRTHSGISQIRWAGDSTLVYLAEQVVYTRPCQTCPIDTLRWGADAVMVSWSGGAVLLDPIPNATDVSSVAVAGGGDTIYYTRNGASAVYRYLRSTQATETVYDFGSGIARDVTVAAGRLVAVVGGRVQYDVDPVLGAVQRDVGGDLYVVYLAVGGGGALGAGPRWYRRPALSPDGSRVVAEGYAYTIVQGDTLVERVPDLWTVPVP